MSRKHIRFIVLLLAMLIPTAIAYAAESVTLENFQVDLVSHVDNQDGTDTFTYAVTGVAATQELSHWVLGMDTCVEHLVSPLPGPYTTVTDIESCSDNTYLCEESHYTVVTGNDPTLGIYGIKFEDGAPQLTQDKTHVFQITVQELAYVEPLNVGAKYGRQEPKDKVDGPVCGSGTAVSLASTSVGPSQVVTLLPLLLTAVVLMAGVTLFVWRREVTAVRTRW